jgi:hypothetical protein
MAGTSPAMTGGLEAALRQAWAVCKNLHFLVWREKAWVSAGARIENADEFSWRSKDFPNFRKDIFGGFGGFQRLASKKAGKSHFVDAEIGGGGLEPPENQNIRGPRFRPCFVAPRAG